MRDITRVIRVGHPNWPGDTPFELTETSKIREGDSVNVMRLTTSNHMGTHLDAPYHYDDDGARLSGVPLELLVGEAHVVHAAGEGALEPDVLPEGALAERVLFFTGQSAHWEAFPEFRPLTPALIHALADRGVRLLGTDSPSVDAFSSKDLPVHRACAQTGIIIVEGLNLTGVREGRHQLVCLPLNMPDADASPVRAILL